MAQFPPLRLAVLQGLITLKQDLSSLDSPECPYDPETIKNLKDLLAPVVVEKERIVEKEVRGRGRPSKDVGLSEEDQLYLKNEIKAQIDKLKELGKGSDTLEPSEQVQISRTTGQLLEKLLGMAERAFNVKRVAEFQSVVMGILDDLVDEKGRETFLKRLEPYR